MRTIKEGREEAVCALHKRICFYYPKESCSIFGHEGVGFGLILVVEGVEVKVLLVAQEALTHQEGKVVAVLQFSQEVVVMEAVDLLDVAKDDVAFASHRLRYVFA